MSIQEKFANAYDKYADAIFRHCYMRVYDRELAKELMQETFAKAWSHYGNVKEVNVENLRALLYKIATNLIIDHSRKPKFKEVGSLENLIEAGLEPGEDRSEEMKNQLDAMDALKILTLLKDEYREVLSLHYLNDLSLAQTAEILGINQNLVSVRLNRAAEAFRKQFKRHERT